MHTSACVSGVMGSTAIISSDIRIIKDLTLVSRLATAAASDVGARIYFSRGETTNRAILTYTCMCVCLSILELFDRVI